jgi:hypothetical protein
MISYPPWAKTPCYECGQEFQITRSEARRVKRRDTLCAECEIGRRGARALDAAVARAEKAEAALSQIREWIDGFDNPTTGMGSGMHQEMWPMLGPAARKRLREILEEVKS